MSVLKPIVVIALALARRGFVVRSGGADGADAAFEVGANHYARTTNTEPLKEIYLPWKAFNGNTSPLYNIPAEAFQIAETIHPAWHKLKRGTKALHARNVCQVLGQDLKTVSQFLICWTKDGKDVGGTRTAIVLARQHKVPVFNLWDYDGREVQVLKELQNWGLL